MPTVPAPSCIELGQPPSSRCVLAGKLRPRSASSRTSRGTTSPTRTPGGWANSRLPAIGTQRTLIAAIAPQIAAERRRGRSASPRANSVECILISRGFKSRALGLHAKYALTPRTVVRDQNRRVDVAPLVRFRAVVEHNAALFEHPHHALGIGQLLLQLPPLSGIEQRLQRLHGQMRHLYQHQKTVRLAEHARRTRFIQNQLDELAALLVAEAQDGVQLRY